MIDIEAQTLQVPGRSVEPIERWGVVFCTMEGSFETVEEALVSCERTTQPPTTIMPLPAAFGATSFEICLKQTMLLADPES